MWAVIEQLTQLGHHVAYHVVPAELNLADPAYPADPGAVEMSAAHTLSDHCHCRPRWEAGKNGAVIWNHRRNSSSQSGNNPQ